MTIPWHFFLLAWALAFLPAPRLRADEEEKAPLFAVESARAAVLKGMLRELRADWSVRVGDGEGTRIAGAQLVSLRRLDVPLPPMPREDHLLLANGDCIPFQQLRLSEEKLSFHHPRLQAGKAASLPLSAVSLLWRDAPAKTLDAEKLYRRLRVEKRTRDVVCLLNGDLVSGVLAGVDKDNAVLEGDKRRQTVKWAQVAYIAFNTELAEVPRPKGVFARLTLAAAKEEYGGRFSLTSASADAETLTATTVFGTRLRVPLRHVAALDVQNGCYVHLSDLKESKYDFQPYLDAPWPFAVDGNVAEHDLRLGASTYLKGIGLHSRARLSYRLAGAYRRFEALVGLDDRDGRGGDVRIRVWADGKILLERALSHRDGGIPIRLGMEGVRELTLEVDFGRGGDVCDVVDWADARLIK
jgi:hypothetical protein